MHAFSFWRWTALMLSVGVCYGAQEPVGVVHARVEVTSDSPGAVPHAPTKPIAIVWGIITGGLNGQGRDVFYTSEVDERASFTVDLRATATALEQAARPVSEKSLVVRPADTRVARLATAAFLPGHPETLLSAEIHVRDPDRGLIAFYVDRPCHLSGQVPLGDKHGPWGHFELDVPHAGLAWAHYDVADGRVLMKLSAQPSEFVYLVFDEATE
jgi:hypothetical protein